MTAIWFNRIIDDGQRRSALHQGDIFLYDRLLSVERLVTFTRQLLEQTFAPHDPERIHEVLSPQELAAVLGDLKPKFTHHPESWRLMTDILVELGCDVDDIHCDVPKLRTAYPVGHLTKGIAYAFPAHRDTWYAAPQAQINWWLPIYPLAADNAMTFYPRYFAKAVANDSDRFDYYRRNRERANAQAFVTDDPRAQPAASGLDADEADVRALPNAGGILIFSGTHLHGTVPNTSGRSRYSIDFRTVSRADVESGRGAAALDVHCTGTALRDFRQAASRAPMSDELARRLDPLGPAEGEILVFDPTQQTGKR
jgi:hypothetical protein